MSLRLNLSRICGRAFSDSLRGGKELSELSFLKRLHDRLYWGLEQLMFFTSASVCMMIIAGAVLRYVFHKDFFGSEDLILLCASWMYYVGSAAATYEDSHISADMISSLLKKHRKAQLIHKIVILAISLILFSILARWAFVYVVWSIAKGQRSAVYRIPMAFCQSAMLLSFVLSVIYTLMHLFNKIKELCLLEKGEDI